MKKSITLAALFSFCCFLAFAQTVIKAPGAESGTSPKGEVADPEDGVLVGEPAPEITFEEELFDFGEIPFGIPVTHKFLFTNTGTAPLLISQAKPSCGCTDPDWTRDEIAPGGKGFIQATFNGNADGDFEKSITVISNSVPPNVVVRFKGHVLPKEEKDPTLDPQGPSLTLPKQ